MDQERNDSMLEEFDAIGFWWLPGREIDKQIGRITFSPNDGGVLEVYGALDSNLQSDADHAVIFGAAVKLGRLTLTENHYSGHSWSHFRDTDNFHVVRYRCDVILKGVHWAEPENELIHKWYIDFDNTYFWQANHRLSIGFPDDTEDPQEQILRIRTMPSLQFSHDGVDFEFGSFVGYSWAHHRASLHGAATVSVYSEKGLKLSTWIDDIVLPLAEFLAFMLGAAVGLARLRSFGIDSKVDGRQIDLDARLHLIVNRRYKKYKRSQWQDRNYVLGFDRCFADDAKLFKRWLDQYDRLKNSAQLYLLARDYPHDFPFQENQFVATVNALEALHRSFYQRPDISKQALDARLKYLFNKNRELFEGKKINIGTLGTVVADTRNHYSHFFPEQKPNVLSGVDIHNVQLVLGSVYVATVLEYLGLDHGDAIENVRRTERYISAGTYR